MMAEMMVGMKVIVRVATLVGCLGFVMVELKVVL